MIARGVPIPLSAPESPFPGLTVRFQAIKAIKRHKVPTYRRLMGMKRQIVAYFDPYFRFHGLSESNEVREGTAGLRVRVGCASKDPSNPAHRPRGETRTRSRMCGAEPASWQAPFADEARLLERIRASGDSHTGRELPVEGRSPAAATPPCAACVAWAWRPPTPPGAHRSRPARRGIAVRTTPASPTTARRKWWARRPTRRRTHGRGGDAARKCVAWRRDAGEEAG